MEWERRGSGIAMTHARTSYGDGLTSDAAAADRGDA
jgi:hypothetical protein